MKSENTFKAIDHILWKEQGCGSELDYLEQKSWMLFLKYLDDLEAEREMNALMTSMEIRWKELALGALTVKSPMAMSSGQSRWMVK